MPPATLSTLPPELLLEILSHLDIPDLLSLSRTTHIFRTLSLDPLLHTFRLIRASNTLSYSLPLRPSLADLIAHRIYVTRTSMAARKLGRDLIKIQLNRRLGNRPSVEVLVEMGVLPSECFPRGSGGEGIMVGYVSPVLVQRKRGLEKERVKDGLREWVREWRERGMRRWEGEGEGKMNVRFLVRRWGRGGERDREERGTWGGKGKRGREEPTRAKVLGLRRFWERVGREGSAV